jgi:hypothetical protein
MCTCTYDVCTARPVDLALADLCLDALSKNLSGELNLRTSEPHECREHECRTLTTEHSLTLDLARNRRCESEALGELFNGQLVSQDLTTVFRDGSGVERGMHTATFRWTTAAGTIVGELSGMTNVGTHRPDAFPECQRCDDTGVMEGRLCGRICRPTEPRFVGAQVFGAYRIAFEADPRGGAGPVRGTFEGVLVRTCEPFPATAA